MWLVTVSICAMLSLNLDLAITFNWVVRFGLSTKGEERWRTLD